jgi:hypothetical protein
MTKFEAGVLTGHVDLLVVGQPIELCSQGVLPNCLKGHSGGVHEQLQCGQALLTVDDAASRQSPEDRVLGLHHDRSKEMLDGCGSGAKTKLG